ncbi:hypothetical protein KC726_01880 [Candidatus Woesebacteria bacterium]|nr:hypothetical protein [Candidatus Woesebacteria bacterium]
MKKIIPHLIPLCILILISVIVHHVWFFNLSPITQGDWGIDYAETIKEYIALPSIWTSSFGLGDINLGISFWPFLFSMGLATKHFFLSPALSERLFILWPVALFTPIFTYFLAYYILKSRVASMVAGVVFTFNTFLMISRGGPLLLHISMTCVPLFLLFFMKTLETKKVDLAIITGLIGFPVSFFEFRMFYIAVLVVGIYTVYFFITNSEELGLKTITKMSALALIALVIPISFNAYLFLGLQNVHVLTSNEIFNRALFGAPYIKLIKIMSMFQYDWTGGRIEPWVVQPILPQFFLVPLLAFIGYFLYRKDKKITFFALLALLAILLTKQTKRPFTELYQWLFDNMPGFNAFRESGKFSYFIALSYSILIGGLVKYFLQKTKNAREKYITYFFALIIVILFLSFAKPLFTGELRALFVPRTRPQDYITLKEFIINQPDYFRVLWVPGNSRWGIRLANHPEMSNYFMNQNSWSDSLLAQNGGVYNISAIYDIAFSNDLLDRSSIKYVVIPLEDKENDNFYRYMGDRKKFIEQIESFDYLHKIDIGTREVLVYENDDFRPHIYTTSQKETLGKNIPYQPIGFERISATEYRIHITDVKEPLYIHFSESYHFDWKIRIGEFHWYDVFFQSNFFLTDKDHFQNDAKLNSFFINPEAICKSNDNCKKSKDGYDIDLTIYFRAQSYVYAGLIISAGVFMLCVSYLGYVLFKWKLQKD